MEDGAAWCSETTFFLEKGMHFLLLWVWACGEDPILAKVREDQAKAATAAPTGTPPAPGVGKPPPGSGAPKAGIPDPPKPGIPEEPAPGRPDEPPPANPGDPEAPKPGQPAPGTPSAPTPGRPAEQQLPKVEVAGNIVFPGWKTGKVRVSAFDGPHAEHAGSQPRIIGEVKLEKPGPFTMQVPQKAGAVYLEAAVDEDADGRPGPLDPQGNADSYPLQVGESPVSGVIISLSRREPPPGAPRKDDF